jgi:SAM-dependent methyltransferase
MVVNELYLQSSRHSNELYRDNWVKERIEKYEPLLKSKTVLDVGAGLSPYAQICRNVGLRYFSQDFEMYNPQHQRNPGLQNREWAYPKHDFSCDLLDIPDTSEYGFVLCTEVLEHVPDPVAALKKISDLTEINGYILITTPLHSLMHQSPYWFSAGLSPFWFKHWAEKLNLEICELEVSGDYIDFIEQELGRLLSFKRRVKGIVRLSKSVRLLRQLLPLEVLECGGFGTFCVLRKKIF